MESADEESMKIWLVPVFTVAVKAKGIVDALIFMPQLASCHANYCGTEPMGIMGFGESTAMICIHEVTCEYKWDRHGVNLELSSPISSSAIRIIATSSRTPIRHC